MTLHDYSAVQDRLSVAGRPSMFAHAIDLAVYLALRLRVRARTNIAHNGKVRLGASHHTATPLKLSIIECPLRGAEDGVLWLGRSSTTMRNHELLPYISKRLAAARSHA